MPAGVGWGGGIGMGRWQGFMARDGAAPGGEGALGMGKDQPEPSAAGWHGGGWDGGEQAPERGGARVLGLSRTPAGVSTPRRVHTKFRSCC